MIKKGVLYCIIFFQGRKLYSSPGNEIISLETTLSNYDDEPFESNEKKRKYNEKKTCIRADKSKNQNRMCIYCKKLIPYQFSQHLLSQHKKEKEIIVYESLTKDNPNRRLIISYVLHRGYSMYNQEFNKKIAASKERMNKEIKKKAPKKSCPFCKALYSHESLRKHKVKCEKIINLIENTWKKNCTS